MAKTSRPTFEINLSADERATLERWARRHSSSGRLHCDRRSCWPAQRAKLPTPRSSDNRKAAVFGRPRSVLDVLVALK